MSAKHTPTPWVIDLKDANYFNIYSEKSAKKVWLPIASIATCHVNAKANAAFLVRAANAHDDLVAAADEALNVFIGCCVPMGGADDRNAILRVQGLLRAALAKVEAM